MTRGVLNDLTGQEFERLTGLSRAPTPSGVRAGTYWRCRCKCGKEVVARADGLGCGDNVSCGCYRREKIRRYHFNESYFAKVTTHEQAAILGMIATDGCVREGYLQLNLKEQDRSYLEKMNASMASDVPVHTYPGGPYTGKDGKTFVKGPYCVSQWYSARMVADLARLGIGPRKTWTVRPWEGPEHLMASYWQGAMDGDGSYFLSGTRWVICFTGNRAMTDGFAEFVRQRLGFQPNAIGRRRNCFMVKYHRGPEVQEITRLLYADAAIWIDRKKEKADAILGKMCRVWRCWLQMTAGELTEAFSRLGTWNAVAKEMGISKNTLRAARCRLSIA